MLHSVVLCPEGMNKGLEIYNVYYFLNRQSASGSSPVILAINKIDCVPSACSTFVDAVGQSFNKHIFTCAISGQGIKDLEAAILELVGLHTIPAAGRKWAVNQVKLFSF